MSHLSKEERKARIKILTTADANELRAAMPFPPSTLQRLLNHLDGTLGAGCDHTLRLTRTFLRGEPVDVEAALAWLAEQGGGCDCEVLANLEELDEDPGARPWSGKIPPRPERVERSLETATGWDFRRLPAPWRIANRFAPTEPLRLELGQKGGCTVTLFEKSLPKGDRDADDYWRKRWQARTRLRAEGAYVIERGALDLPTSLEAVLVGHGSQFFCWVVPESGAWHLEVSTDARRLRGDLPQVAALIRHLAGEVV